MKKLLSVLVLAAAVCCAGVVLAEEAVIEGPILTYQIEDWDWMIPPYVKGAITLTEGWNLIAIPVIPQQPVTVETFSKMVAYSDEPIYKTDPKLPDDNFIQAKRSSWQVRAVAVYKDGRFRVYPKEGVTYNMVPGEAYFVYAEYHGLRPAYSELIANPPPGFEPWHPKTTVTIVGKSVNASVSLDLNKGWNGAALMLKQKPYYDFDMPITKLPRIPFLKVDKSDSDISNAQFPIDEGKIFGPINIGSSLSQLSRELVEQGVKAKRIVFWNAENQAWDQYELPRPEPVYRHIPGLWDLGVELGGVDEYTVVFDPGINADQGFFLLCEENGLYIPGLRQIQKPPYPPFPPG